MRPIIIAIIGASGSGKTYAAKFLKNELNIPVIVSYTTRPIRSGEIEGEDHHFITKKFKPPKKEMLAFTRFGGYDYFALHSQVPQKSLCSYVIDEDGLEMLKQKYSDRYSVIAIAIKCNPSALHQRGIEKERVLRDKARKNLPDHYFYSIIYNNGSLENFKASIIHEINKLQLCQHPK